MNKIIKPELLAPAGSFLKLKMALKYGADAVYLAGNQFGLRTASKNFDNKELRAAIEYTHSLGKKVYITINVIPHNKDIKNLPIYLKMLSKLKPDALIISDLGVLTLAKQYAPNIDIHISTQANSVNFVSVNEWHKMGAKRVILARELSLNEIKEIRRKAPKSLELEAFVHGAMCISYSGRCHLSNYMTDRDANMGECSQPCRWKYFLMEEKRQGEYFPVFEEDNGAFIMNSKDLNMIEHIPNLMNVGLTSFKIEGRVKTEYYVATVTNAYRQAIDAYCDNKKNYVFNPEWLEEVKKVSHRPYYTGFYFGNEKSQGQVYESSSYIREYDVVAMVDEDVKKQGFTLCSQRNKFSVGDELELLSPNSLSKTFTLTKLTDGNGNDIVDAPHPMMKLKMIVPFDTKKDDIIRKAK